MLSPKRILFSNGPILLPDRLMRDSSVLVEGDRIAAVRETAFDPGEADEVFDLNGCTLMPGLIDLHIHGSCGIDLMTASADDLAEMSRYLRKQGVTHYLPTTVPVDEDGFTRVIEVLTEYISDQPADGAQVLGIHFEGPFVNPTCAGALAVRHFREFASRESAALFLDESLGDRFPIRMITLAPEIDGGLDLVTALSSRGYIVAIGHSQASFEMCEQAGRLGARHVTHFPNALAPLHHRRPGVFGWALVRGDVTLDVIADGVHVDWRVFDLIQRMKERDNITIISDAIAPTGLGDGQYEMWGETVTVCNGQTRNEKGAMAGSVVTLRESIQRLRRRGVSLVEIATMASLNPARVLGIDHFTGSLVSGKRADLVGLREDGMVEFTCVNGVVFKSD